MDSALLTDTVADADSELERVLVLCVLLGVCVALSVAVPVEDQVRLPDMLRGRVRVLLGVSDSVEDHVPVCVDTDAVPLGVSEARMDCEPDGVADLVVVPVGSKLLLPEIEFVRVALILGVQVRVKVRVPDREHDRDSDKPEAKLAEPEHDWDFVSRAVLLADRLGDSDRVHDLLVVTEHDPVAVSLMLTDSVAEPLSVLVQDGDTLLEELDVKLPDFVVASVLDIVNDALAVLVGKSEGLEEREVNLLPVPLPEQVIDASIL